MNIKQKYNPTKLVKNKLQTSNLLNTISTDSLPDPTLVTNNLSTELANTLVVSLPLELANTLVAESLPLELANTLVSESLPEPLEIANTLVSESLPTELANTLVSESLPLELLNTLVSESLPEPLELANTLLSESLPLELVNTLVSESLPTELANTLLSESLPEPLELANTLVSESLPIELANSLVAESLPTKLENTLVAESLPTELIENTESINPSEVVNILLESQPKEIVRSLPSPFDAIYKKPKQSFRIQLPTFNNEVKNEVKNELNNENQITDEKNQDTIQKLAVVSTLVLELYRMLTSSLLILFVPQSCGGNLCSISDNLTWNPDHHQYNFGICVNFITLFIFSCLYAVELKRENRLIKYLHVNPEMPSSNDAVEKTLEHIDIEKKRKILAIDKQYQRISYCSIGMYAFNSIVSGVIISQYYFGSQTTTSFITSLLFMFTKLINVYQVSNTEENIFYSGYMKTFVQFNDLDETHKIPDNL